MSMVEEIRFLQRPVKVSRDETGGIAKICINDICLVLKRALFLKDGTARRKCPSAAMLDQSQPEELYADFDELTGFVKWIAAGSKLLAPVCRSLLETLQQVRIVPVAPGADPAEQPGEIDGHNDEVILLEYSGSKFSMKVSGGRYMVNATEMAKLFDKRPTVWLKLAETVRLRQALVDDGVFKDTESQVMTSRGPYGATWLEIHLWVQFAQWLSPAFAAWCSQKTVSLMQDGRTSMPADYTGDSGVWHKSYNGDRAFSDNLFLPVPATYEEALAVIETQKNTIDRQRDFIVQNQHKHEHYDITVDGREWFNTTMIAIELGVSPIKLNLFLMDENVQHKADGQWVIAREYKHLRCVYPYAWYNHKTKYTNVYKIDAWNPQGREYIISLWKKENG